MNCCSLIRFATVGGALLLSTAAHADSLLVISGPLLEGTLVQEVWTFSTNAGEMEMPRTSIRRITLGPTSSGDAQSEIVLRDGSVVTGHLKAEVIELKQPLMQRRVPVAEIREIEFSDSSDRAPAPQFARPAQEAAKIVNGRGILAAGSSVPLELARTLGSGGQARPGETVALCVSGDVMLGDVVVIPAGRVALGELAVVDPAGAAERVGRLVIEVKKTWTVDGTEVPLKAQAAFEGSFNAGNIVGAGALGLLSQGGQANAMAGATVTAEVARGVDIDLQSKPPAGAASIASTVPQALQERCDLYRRLRNQEGWVRLNDVPKDLDLAPFRSPMHLEIAIPTLPILKKNEGWQAYLVRRFRCEDVSFANLTLTRKGGPKEKATFDFEAMIKVEPSFDRWVDLRLELVAGGRTIAKGAVGHIDAEEGKTVTAMAHLVADAAEIGRIAPDDPALLRITMYVTKN